MIPSNSTIFACSPACSFSNAGNSTSRALIAVAICIAVGKVSLDDWPILQWSLGCTGSFEPITPPSISIARFAITSFEFIFDCVPDPVCQTTSGKLSSNLPSITSLAAWVIATPRRSSKAPRVILASAQAFLITPSARTMATGCFSQPIGKLIIERCVCAPQYLFDGTSRGPKLSVSVRVCFMLFSYHFTLCL